jgi:hypothetical protein
VAPRSLALSILAAGSLLAAISCGGGDDDTNQGAPTATIELTGTAREYAASLDNGLTAIFRVTYETTTPEGDPGEVYIIYNRPPMARVDIVPADPAEGQTLFIGRDGEDNVTGCSGGPDAWECSETPLGGPVLRTAGPVAFYTANDLTQFEVTRLPQDRTIAGQSTTCYEFTPNGAGGGEPSEFCLTDSGVVLYSSTPSQTVEATEFSSTVEDADFTPPVTPS